jgi:hypothetical protein
VLHRAYLATGTVAQASAEREIADVLPAGGEGGGAVMAIDVLENKAMIGWGGPDRYPASAARMQAPSLKKNRTRKRALPDIR